MCWKMYEACTLQLTQNIYQRCCFHHVQWEKEDKRTVNNGKMREERGISFGVIKVDKKRKEESVEEKSKMGKQRDAKWGKVRNE